MVITDTYQLAYSEPFTLRPMEEARVDLVLHRVPKCPDTVVRGRVTSCGHVLAGATVKVLNEAHSPKRHARTSVDGTYRIEDLRPGKYLATASAPGYGTAPVAEFALGTGQTETVSFELEEDWLARLGFVYGIATGRAEGLPLRGVRVSLRACEAGSGEVATTVTNRRGQYLLGGLQPGTYALAAVRSGYEESPPATVAVSAGEYSHADIALNPKPGDRLDTVSGVVKAAGCEAPGTVVGLYRIEDGREDLIQTKSATKEGLYLFTDVEPGRYRVKAKGLVIGMHDIPKK